MANSLTRRLSVSDVLQLGRQGPDGGEGSRLPQAASSLPASREQDQMFRVRNLEESLMLDLSLFLFLLHSLESATPAPP